MLITTVQMTPEMAEMFLAKNTNNRPVRKYRINEFIDIINSGEWKLTHQGIGVDVNGVLLDGQHRLEAIKRAGKTVPVMLVEELPPSSRMAIDTHAKRSFSDILGTKKELLNPVVFLARVWKSQSNVRPPLVNEIFDVFGPYVERLQSTVDLHGQRVLGTVPIRAAAVLRMATGNEDYVVNLYRNMVEVKQEELPTVARSFLKQMMQSYGPYALGNKQRVDLVRAWIVFGPDNAETQRVMVKDHTVRLADIRAAIDNVMSGSRLRKAA